MPEPRSRRSELATPASSERMCEKAATSGADLVFLDLEDACAPAPRRAPAPSRSRRSTSSDWGRTVRAVRINGLDTPWCHDDIIEVVTGAGDHLDVLIVPKARTARDVWWVDVLLTQLEAKLRRTHRIGLEVLIEESEGPGRTRRRSPVRASGWRRSSSGPATSRRPSVPASTATSTRSASTRATSGTTPASRWSPRPGPRASTRSTRPYPAYQDPDGYRRSATHASLLGFDGKWAIHPSQIAIANEVFAPTAGGGRRGARGDRGLPAIGGRGHRRDRARRSVWSTPPTCAWPRTSCTRRRSLGRGGGGR